MIQTLRVSLFSLHLFASCFFPLSLPPFCKYYMELFCHSQYTMNIKHTCWMSNRWRLLVCDERDHKWLTLFSNLCFVFSHFFCLKELLMADAFGASECSKRKDANTGGFQGTALFGSGGSVGGSEMNLMDLTSWSSETGIEILELNAEGWKWKRKRIITGN